MSEVGHQTTWTCVVCGTSITFPTHRWNRISMWKLGWYVPKSEDMAFCPVHCPPFAANYPVRGATGVVELLP